MDRVREFRRGLAATAPYLLSHHERFERCHTIAVPLIGSRVHLCARCSGIYPGIVLGAMLTAAGWWPSWVWLPVLVAVLPSAALLDWARSARFGRAGSNRSRTLTGLGLGTAYGTALAMLYAGTHRPWVLLVGVVYGALAVLGLWRAGRLE